MMATYKHDCEQCVSLGDYTYKDQLYDLYFCPIGGLPSTVIARFGDEGSEYHSGIAIAQLYKATKGYTDHPMVIAYDRAKEKGYVDDDAGRGEN